MVDKMANENVEIVDKADFDRSREQALRQLETAMSECHRKIESGRVRSVDKERVRQGWIKTLARAINVYRLLLKDKELEEIKDEIDELRDQMENA